VWNPFRSKLAAGILGGLDNIHVSSDQSASACTRLGRADARSHFGRLVDMTILVSCWP
jgi:fibrillarin-like rRNA methylase